MHIGLDQIAQNLFLLKFEFRKKLSIWNKACGVHKSLKDIIQQ